MTLQFALAEVDWFCGNAMSVKDSCGLKQAFVSKSSTK